VTTQCKKNIDINAQASMSRIIDKLPIVQRNKFLASPGLALEKIRDVLGREPITDDVPRD
jgi:hypothetical protein